MSWLRDKLVSDRKSVCYGEVGYYGTHGHHDLFLCQALLYGSNHDSNFDVHV